MLRSPTQLKDWVKKYKQGEPLADQRVGESRELNPFHRLSKTTFKSIEEERDYLKAQVDGFSNFATEPFKLSS